MLFILFYVKFLSPLYGIFSFLPKTRQTLPVTVHRRTYLLRSLHRTARVPQCSSVSVQTSPAQNRRREVPRSRETAHDPHCPISFSSPIDSFVTGSAPTLLRSAQKHLWQATTRPIGVVSGHFQLVQLWVKPIFKLRRRTSAGPPPVWVVFFKL